MGMRVDLDGTITTVTEMCYSYADSKRDGSTLNLPMYGGKLAIPGRLLRGCLRHRNFEPINERLVAEDRKLSLADWRFNLLGGVLQEGGRDYNILLDRPRFEVHPFVGLWGCMEPVAYWGKIQVEIASAIGDVRPVLMSGQRTDPIQRGEIGRDDVADPTEFDAYIAALGGNRAARQERAKPKRNGNNEGEDETPRKLSQNLPFARQMIPRDAQFDSHISLKRGVTDLQLGQFLIALEQFSTDPYLGAQCGVNAGIVNMDYQVSLDGRTIGAIHIDGRGRSIEMGDLRQYVELFWRTFPNMDFAVPGDR